MKDHYEYVLVIRARHKSGRSHKLGELKLAAYPNIRLDNEQRIPDLENLAIDIESVIMADFAENLASVEAAIQAAQNAGGQPNPEE